MASKTAWRPQADWRRIIRRPLDKLTWLVDVDPITEEEGEDGGTFYRPNSGWCDIRTNEDDPDYHRNPFYPSGWFSLPGATLGVGVDDEDGSYLARSWIQFADASGTQIGTDILQAYLSVTNGSGLASDSAPLLRLLQNPEGNLAGVAKVRFKIIGSAGLTWSSGGLITRWI